MPLRPIGLNTRDLLAACGWSTTPKQPKRAGNHILDGQAILLIDRLVGRRGAKAIDAHCYPLRTNPALPAKRDAGLDREASCDIGWEDAVAVGGRLRLEKLPAWEADH